LSEALEAKLALGKVKVVAQLAGGEEEHGVVNHLVLKSLLS
jgi:hypothetical protein